MIRFPRVQFFAMDGMHACMRWESTLQMHACDPMRCDGTHAACMPSHACQCGRVHVRDAHAHVCVRACACMNPCIMMQSMHPCIMI
jgi:hypothetical protein